MTVVDPQVRTLTVPDLSLVVLVGASGAGKSTFAARHFGRFEVVSSDTCRGMVSDDENDQSATAAAFELLGQIVTARLRRGLLTVVDATSVQPGARRSLVDLARSCDVLPVAVVLDVPEAVCAARNAARPDRAFGADVVRRQADQLRRSLKGLNREGFRRVHVLRGTDEVGAATIVREPLLTDRRGEVGPFDVIGDVHGCREELEALLGRLGWVIVRDDAGRPVDAVHPDGRTAVFLGDLVDRGPDSPGVLRLAMGMVAAGHALAVPGNHEHKLVRALDGKAVTVSHGLETTLEQLAAEPAGFSDTVREFCRGLVSHLVLDGGRLVVAHAGLKEAYHGRASGRVRSFALYGDTTGESDEFGLPVRLDWAAEYRGAATVLYGHTPTPTATWVNRTMCLDTGAVFGGHLSALRYPEREVVAVPAQRVWYEPARPFPTAGDGAGGGAEGASARPDGVLDLSDVLGRRVVETAHGGRVSVREEQAAGALEVMSRFALPPEQLLHLPATMAPAPTSRRPDVLEHPEDAFAAYADDGVEQVVCEEKHMGSRAVVLLRADGADAAGGAGGADGGGGAGGAGGGGSGAGTSPLSAVRGVPGLGAGAVWTRTGRSFFDAALTDRLLAGLRAAATAAGLWEELGTRWLLLDAEVLPWSAKADGLVRSRFAAVGAAARAALPSASAALAAAASRGLGEEESAALAALAARTRSREGSTAAFTDAYRRYVWPTGVASGTLDGVRVAPFSVLASEGAVHVGRDHLWHLALADRLAAAAPDLVTTTRRLVVTTSDPASVAEGTAWWEDLTATGGEGMVVKPLAGGLVTRAKASGRTQLVQPGLKVRGREYLRLVYGPQYTDPGVLERLRGRQLGHKRSLALREHALGVEALDRVVAGEPLWRVHEAVFAVLACESEPVDPRL